jgi:Pectate lyase superfamily protein
MVPERPERTLPFPAVSRRTLLAGGGVVAAGAGAAVVAATAFGGGSGPTDRSPFDVRAFGAVGDGRADDTASIQRAIDAARAGGGVVSFPPGTYLTGRLTLYSRIHLRGSGGDATVLRLKPGANSAIVESHEFGRLTGTRGDGGITMFSVRDLTLDGDKRHNPRGGYGLRLYGYGYEVTDVIAYNCRNDGIFSEWGTNSGLPFPSHQMEARLSSVRSHDNDGHGIHFKGPHDSMFLNCVHFQNGGAGFRLDGDSGGSLMVNCHAWGIRQDVSFDLAAPSIGCMNCYADLNGGVGVRISRNDCRWIGGLVLGAAQPKNEVGIQLAAGDAASEPAGAVIDAKVMNCGTAAVDFGADRGLSSVRALVSPPRVLDTHGVPVPDAGRGWTGRPHPSTQVEITSGLDDPRSNLVVRPAFDLRAQANPPAPSAATVRVFARQNGGKTQLCAIFPGGAIQVLASDG